MLRDIRWSVAFIKAKQNCYKPNLEVCPQPQISITPLKCPKLSISNTSLESYPPILPWMKTLGYSKNLHVDIPPQQTSKQLVRVHHLLTSCGGRLIRSRWWWRICQAKGKCQEYSQDDRWCFELPQIVIGFTDPKPKLSDILYYNVFLPIV